jgi:hypothetical protein
MSNSTIPPRATGHSRVKDVPLRSVHTGATIAHATVDYSGLRDDFVVEHIWWGGNDVLHLLSEEQISQVGNATIRVIRREASEVIG